ncbi:hypothetical protein BSZ35_02450 [Salinibacter sp. 10B]|uniref:hypothetical protein n=1 Tax=Salinibacter sp. 10B TaxID=1923971 RepID=UPI000CF502F3|nr:hypothetical protein [Salinibacter sp. 10B]PQJ33610.1 hypothetical protein BSZ35_02450 [Salinibacter sp. 10B]
MLAVPGFSSPWPNAVEAKVEEFDCLFGAAFDYYFRQSTSGNPPEEVPLFRSMQDAFERMSRHFYVEEYHGQVSQVEFAPPTHDEYDWARSSPQCELADLLIVAFRTGKNPSIRLTLLQAKSERNRRTPHLDDRPWFKANMEQWDLLSRRPPIEGAFSTFNPPRSLLADALLPSVGTFGFFYRNHGQDDYHLYYGRAESFNPTYNYSTRYGGRLKVSNTQLAAQKHGFTEACLAPDTPEFGALMNAQLIGTPIHAEADPYSSTSWIVRRWLLSLVRSAVEERRREIGDEGIEVGEFFLETFGDGEDIIEDEIRRFAPGTKSLVLIKTNGKFRTLPPEILARL